MTSSYLHHPTVKLISYSIFLLLILIVVLMVDVLRLPLILSLVVCFILAPVADVLERRGFSRSVALLVIYLVLGLIVAIPVYLLTPWFIDAYKQIVSGLPRTLAAMEGEVQGFFQKYGQQLPEQFRAEVIEKSVMFIQTMGMSALKAIPANIPNILTAAILFPVFSFFMVRDSNRIGKALLAPIPNRYFEISLNISYMISKKVGAYVRGRLIESLIVWCIVSMGLTIIGFDYAIVHGLFAGIMNLIPFVGPFFGAAPALVLSFVHFDSWFTVLGVVCVFTAAQLVDNILFIPVVLAKIIDLHPIWVIVAIFAGSQFYGAIGMLISVPIVVILKIVIEEAIRGFAGLK